MEYISELFIDNNNKFSSDNIMIKIKNKAWDDILHGLCNKADDGIIIDYNCFKFFATSDTYNIITSLICKNIDEILETNKTVNVYINLKMLTLKELDKHKNFIQTVSHFLKNKYPNKLAKCYVYNAPMIFSQFFSIISFLIDKDTLSKIELVNK